MTHFLNLTKHAAEELYVTGIYSIVSKIDNKFYIGSAARSNNTPSQSGFYARWWSHRRDLLKGIHHCKHLQSAWNKYGEENFEFKIVELTDREFCIETEQNYLDLSNKEFLYNDRYTADSFANCKRDPDTVKKIVDKNSKPFYIVSPQGDVIEGINLKKFCRDNCLHQHGLQQVLEGKVLHSLGWTSSLDNHAEYLKRKELRGICWDKKANAWRVRLPGHKSPSGKREAVGWYKDLEAAQLERDRIEIQYDFMFLVNPRRSGK